MGPVRTHIEALPTARAERLLATPGATIVDLRSPAEFAQDHVPGASNVPLFGDAQRALVGTLYRRVSPEAAFGQAREMVLAGVGGLVAGIGAACGWEAPRADLAARVEALTREGIAGMSAGLECARLEELPARPVFLHCWRGGLRSRSVVALVRGLGLGRAVLLEDGYRGWRAHVRRELDDWSPPGLFVLRGLTGVGKTLVLRAIERLRPGSTIDLEELAGHRSSLLGMVGLEPRSQKAFESRLCARLRDLRAGPLVVEGESRRVGDVTLPRSLWRGMGAGVSIGLEAPLERRVEVLEADYAGDARTREELRARLPHVEARMHRPGGAPALVVLLDRGETGRLARELLADYYDPLYRHGERRRRALVRFDATDPELAAARIVEWIGDRRGTS